MTGWPVSRRAVRAPSGVRRAVLVGLLISSGTAAAAPPLAEELDVSVNVTRTNTDISYAGGGGAELSYTRIAAAVRQTSLPWFQPGLTVGTGWLDVDNNPRGDEDSFDGESGGLTLHSRIPLAEPLSLLGQAAWIYHDLNASGGASYEWYDTTGSLGLVADLERVRLAGGVTARYVDGEQRRQGADSREFEVDDSAGAYASLGVRIQGGLITLRGEAGTRAGVEVSFSRRF